MPVSGVSPLRQPEKPADPDSPDNVLHPVEGHPDASRRPLCPICNPDGWPKPPRDNFDKYRRTRQGKLCFATHIPCPHGRFFRELPDTDAYVRLYPDKTMRG